MKANELRIGNLVEFGKSTLVVDTISSSDNVILITKNGSNCTTNLKFCKPILLTEEWLLKFGFVQYQKKPLFYLQLSRHFRLRANIYSIEGKMAFIISLPYHYPTPTINKVHQLQNLYFALTGEELTITPGSKPD